MPTTTSTTITFAVVTGDAADASIRVILDAEANNNKTSFASGDTANFIVITNPPEMVIALDTTMGVISGGQEKVFEIVGEVKQFIKADKATLDYIPLGAVTTSWIGRSGGNISVEGATLTVPAKVNGILSCDYSAKGRAYALSGVIVPADLDSVQVLVVISAA
jgi:hypothetical protein